MPAGWIIVYDLGRDAARVRQVQKVSRETEEFGFPTTPALFGSRKWWRLVDRGELPSWVLEGVVDRVYWASMGDYPEFGLRGPEGSEHTFTREGDIRRYVEGLQARVRVVELDRKSSQVAKGIESKASVVVWIALEDSPLRSPAVAPGPGGAGYEIAGGRGARVLYFAAARRAIAEAVASAGEGLGGQARTWEDLMGEAWTSVALATDAAVGAMTAAAVEHGARYDGYEVVPTQDNEPVAHGPNEV